MFVYFRVEAEGLVWNIVVGRLLSKCELLAGDAVFSQACALRINTYLIRESRNCNKAEWNNNSGVENEKKCFSQTVPLPSQSLVRYTETTV